MNDITQAACEAALASLNASESFQRADRLKQLLNHIVNKTLAGNSEALLGKNLAQDVFGIDPTASEDLSAVRVEIGRLRRRHHEYYADEGKSDPLIIDVPKGAYVATFQASVDKGDPSRGAKRHIPKLVFAGLSVVAMFLFAFVLWSAFSQHSPKSGISKPKIAVLPFLNVSGDPDDTYLANGFTTEMIVAMARSEHLVTVSRAATAKASGDDVRKIGQKLSAQYVIRGSIRKSETDLRVSVELSDTETADIVWAKIYSKPLTSAEGFETAAEIAEQVARTVAKPFGVVFSQALSKPKPAGFSSYQCILKAYDFERKRGTEYHAEVRDCLEETVRREPELATAWALLSAVYLDEYRNGYNRLNAPLDRALNAALRAVEFAPEEAQSHWALALVYFFQVELAAFSSSADQALKLAPNDADMTANIGFKLVISGSDWDGGVELMDQAMQMSPAHPPLWYFPRALFEYRRHAYEDALAAANWVNIPKLYMSHMFRAMILGQLGKTEDAKRAAKEIIRLKPDFSISVRSDLRRRNIPEDMIAHMIDGLRKAGLQIPSK